MLKKRKNQNMLEIIISNIKTRKDARKVKKALDKALKVLELELSDEDPIPYNYGFIPIETYLRKNQKYPIQIRLIENQPKSRTEAVKKLCESLKVSEPSHSDNTIEKIKNTLIEAVKDTELILKNTKSQ